jgi:hypothetical protein
VQSDTQRPTRLGGVAASSPPVVASGAEADSLPHATAKRARRHVERRSDLWTVRAGSAGSAAADLEKRDVDRSKGERAGVFMIGLLDRRFVVRPEESVEPPSHGVVFTFVISSMSRAHQFRTSTTRLW